MKGRREEGAEKDERENYTEKKKNLLELKAFLH
jgi:hypothetical protein